MATALDVLIVANRLADVELLLRPLRRAGFDPHWRRVETRADYLASLSPEPEVILADDSLPQLSVPAALRLLRKLGADIPFLLLTRADSEERALECLKHGAADYLFKDRLGRLGAVVARALEQRRLRAEKQQSEAARRESERRLRLLAESTPDMVLRSTREGICLYASPACHALLGYKSEEMVGRSALQLSHPEDRPGLARAWAELAGSAAAHTLTHRARRKDGQYVWLETTGWAVRDPQTGGVLEIEALSCNASQQEQSEDRVRAALRQKELLLREVHHRVKNNLQAVCSLLLLQSQHVKDAQAREAFQESQSRIRSIALAHAKLCRAEDLARINMAEYLHGLAPQLAYPAAAGAEKIDVKISAANVFLGIDTAVPCGLIINELVSHSRKHALPPGQGREIRIALRLAAEDEYELTVADNGVGPLASTSLDNAQSLSLQMVGAMAKQLDAVVEVGAGTGTTFRFTFGEQKYKERVMTV